MNWPDPRARQCLDVVAGKWVIDVIQGLSLSPKRYTDLHIRIEDVASSMLTRTLQRMERDGILTRTVHPAIPPQVEYELTLLGLSLKEPLEWMALWSRQHHDEVVAARRRYDHRR